MNNILKYQQNNFDVAVIIGSIYLSVESGSSASA